jgi:hypothetical protein
LRNASDTAAATVTAREGARLEDSDREAVLCTFTLLRDVVADLDGGLRVTLLADR